MFSHRASIDSTLRSFHLDGRMLCYNSFVPKLYNWCLSMGFSPGKIMPSRAFCSDESQGFPIILLAKHFGAFPFNHGRVGGIVSVQRHGPHADHGKDLLLVQASHVGYDPETGEFGSYRRLHAEFAGNTCACGKVGHTLEWYREQYAFACENIRLTRHAGQPAVLIDNLLLESAHVQGLFLVHGNLIHGASEHGLPKPLEARSTGLLYRAAATLVDRLGMDAWPSEGSITIGRGLAAEDFYFQRDLGSENSDQNQLERNLLAPMPWILTAPHPLLTAACANTQAEFDRTYRSLALSPAMHGKNLLFLAGVNIDISPLEGEDFPLTKFAPWAAFLQRADGSRELLEQDEVLERLGAHSTDNPAQLALDRAIEVMTQRNEVNVRL